MSSHHAARAATAFCRRAHQAPLKARGHVSISACFFPQGRWRESRQCRHYLCAGLGATWKPPGCWCGPGIWVSLSSPWSGPQGYFVTGCLDVFGLNLNPWIPFATLTPSSSPQWPQWYHHVWMSWLKYSELLVLFNSPCHGVLLLLTSTHISPELVFLLTARTLDLSVLSPLPHPHQVYPSWYLRFISLCCKEFFLELLDSLSIHISLLRRQLSTFFLKNFPVSSMPLVTPAKWR